MMIFILNAFSHEISFYICSIYFIGLNFKNQYLLFIHFKILKNNDMKKYFFVFSLLSLLTSVACDTSSKASSTQTLTRQPETVTQVVLPAVIDTTSDVKLKKGYSKKKMQMHTIEMMPSEKVEPLRKGDEAPVKKQ
jgi:hypothetical protein